MRYTTFDNISSEYAGTAWPEVGGVVITVLGVLYVAHFRSFRAWFHERLEDEELKGFLRVLAAKMDTKADESKAHERFAGACYGCNARILHAHARLIREVLEEVDGVDEEEKSAAGADTVPLPGESVPGAGPDGRGFPGVY